MVVIRQRRCFVNLTVSIAAESSSFERSMGDALPFC